MSILVPLPWEENDGGRSEAGFMGSTGDCTCRAFAIAMDRPYSEVYEWINARCRRWFPTSGISKHSARLAIPTAMIKELLLEVGFTWTPTMKIGSGCRVHLAEGELPGEGRLIVNVSKHMVAVVDGVVLDTHDPTRGGTRCVYGYWTAPPSIGDLS